MRHWGLAVVAIATVGCSSAEIHTEADALSGACQAQLWWIGEIRAATSSLDDLLSAGDELSEGLVHLQALSARAGTGVLTESRTALSQRFAQQIAAIEAIAAIAVDGVRLADGSTPWLVVQTGPDQPPFSVMLPIWTPEGLGLGQAGVANEDDAQQTLALLSTVSRRVFAERAQLVKARTVLEIEHDQLRTELGACASADPLREAKAVEPADDRMLVEIISSNLADGRAATQVALGGIDTAERILERLAVLAEGASAPGTRTWEQAELQLRAQGRIASLDALAASLSYADVPLTDGSVEELAVLWSDGIQQTTFRGSLPDLTSGGLGIEPDALDLSPPAGAEGLLGELDAALATLQDHRALLLGFDQVLTIIEDLTISK